MEEAKVRRILEQVRDIGTIEIEDLLDLTKEGRFDPRQTIVAIHLIDNKLITVEEAIESLNNNDNFFLASTS